MSESFQYDFRFVRTGTRLKHARQQQGINIADLAERSGVSVDIICQIENGHTEQYLSHCIVLAVELGQSFEALFEGERHSGELAETVNRILAGSGKWTMS